MVKVKNCSKLITNVEPTSKPMLTGGNDEISIDKATFDLTTFGQKTSGQS